MARNPFLSASWRNLLMANYTIDPTVLKPFLPYKTAPDLYDGKCYVSVVGFLFENTRVRGIQFPYHSHFEEVNLRFYVLQDDGSELKRGVVFIREIVPRFMIAAVANMLYRENYRSFRMQHDFRMEENAMYTRYAWKNRRWNSMTATAVNKAAPVPADSEAGFITGHYWGYAKRTEASTIEYRVSHPVWNLFPVIDYSIDIDFELNYGNTFSFLNGRQPDSVFLAEGSDVAVYPARIIR